MKFDPQKYKIPDERMKPFIDVAEIDDLLKHTGTSEQKVEKIIAKALNKQRLSMEDTAALLNADSPELLQKIKDGAMLLKQRIYGNRIVLFAPLYIGNYCSNNCTYCGFNCANKNAIRKTLSNEEIIQEIISLEDTGQKRLILVYGEHDNYSPQFIADNVRLVYSVKHGNGAIRRVNINAAPLDIEGFKIVKDAGIGTYQIFQETYHPEVYKKYHLSGKKTDFNYRLTGLDRAQEAGIDDVGIGALFGLYDWKYEVMGLIRHVNHLEACYGVGPHTISFPRIQEYSSKGDAIGKYNVSDEDFIKIIAILRLAVPYTGLILTARESVELRKEAIKYGVSQIDGGTKLEIGAYSTAQQEQQDLNKEQFLINDNRTLDEIIADLTNNEYIPSFCTACYRVGRTGEHFMEFSVPGFIKEFCTPNAILTFAEYLCDYASDATKDRGWQLIYKTIETLEDHKMRKNLIDKLELIKKGDRDLFF